MSHIVSLRSASLRALRSNSTTRLAIAAATKCTIYPHGTTLHQQQSTFSTLPLTPNKILSTQNSFKQRVRKVVNLL